MVLFVGLGLVQLANVLGNHTTIELLLYKEATDTGKPITNIFTLGRKRNLRQVFGSDFRYWLLPVWSTEGDGTYFETNGKTPLV